MNYMKWYFFVLISYLSLSAPALPPSGDIAYKTFFTWSENRKLQWVDFQGTAYPNADEVAMAATSVEFNYSTKGDKISWTVTSKFFPKASWTKIHTENEEVLKHEQLHFDITELYARTLRKALKENIFSRADLNKIRVISDQVLDQWSKEQDNYDKKTNHGINKQQQKYWENTIEKRLNALQEFASP